MVFKGSLLSVVLLLRSLLTTSGRLSPTVIILLRRVVEDFSLLLLKVLPLILLFLVSIEELNVSVNYSSQIVQGIVSADSGNFKLASLLLLFDVKLHDSTLLIEEAQIFLIMAADILDESIVEGNENTLECDFTDGIFNASLCFAKDNDLTLISSRD
jgi:hypothetical protein